MRVLSATASLLLVLFLLGIGIAACGSGLPLDRVATQETASATAGTVAAGTPVPGPGLAADPLAAKLTGLGLDEFFEVSWRELRLRDPEAIVADGLATELDLQDATLTDISDAYVRQTYDMCETILDVLRTYNRDELTSEQQISFDVYEWYLEDQVRERTFMYHDYPATFFPVTAVHEETIHFFTDLHPLGNMQDAQDYVARLGQVGVKFEQLIDGLKLREEAGFVPPRFAIQWALYGVRGMANSTAKQTPFYTALQGKLAALPQVSADEAQALLESAEEAINESVLPAFRALAEYLAHQETVASTDAGLWQFGTGRDYYDHLLRHYTTTELTAEEIHDLGQEELVRIHAEMHAIFDQLGYPQDEDLPMLYDRVARDGGTVPADQIIEEYESLINEASANLTAAFNIQPRAELIVVQSPIKGMYVHASLDGSRPGAFHAGPARSPEQYYAMPTLAYHEAIPGHHFQIALAQESDLPSFRNSLGFLGYAEGWALYAEQLASELGWYADDPYADLGRLQAEAFRAARLVVDTGIHVKRWTWDEAVDFFVENTGYEPGDSVDPDGQIARYIVWPAQATSYKIGMLKLLELRQRAMDELDEQFDLKEFHAVVLSNGSMPLQVLERVVDDYIAAKLGS
jgi:uncharacterized protein (DUF885 family)